MTSVAKQHWLLWRRRAIFDSTDLLGKWCNSCSRDALTMRSAARLVRNGEQPASKVSTGMALMCGGYDAMSVAPTPQTGRTAGWRSAWREVPRAPGFTERPG